MESNKVKIVAEFMGKKHEITCDCAFITGRGDFDNDANGFSFSLGAADVPGIQIAMVHHIVNSIDDAVKDGQLSYIKGIRMLCDIDCMFKELSDKTIAKWAMLATKDPKISLNTLISEATAELHSIGEEYEHEDADNDTITS